MVHLLHVIKSSTFGTENVDQLLVGSENNASAVLTVAITSFGCPLKRFSCRRAILDAGAHHAVRSFSAPIGWQASKTVLSFVVEISRDKLTAFHLPQITRGAQYTFVIKRKAS